MNNIRIKILPVDGSVSFSPPEYATAGAAACDLRAAIAEPEVVPAGERALIPAGFRMELPEGYAAFVFARSGLAVKNGICLSNGVGVIDSDYRGEVKVGLANLSGEDFTVNPGDRIAQMAVMPVCRAVFDTAAEITGSARGEGGFGSTGISG